jgi:hypothetical protein
VALLPEDVHLWTLSIGTIEGDDGSLAEALTSAITSATSIQLMKDGAKRGYPLHWLKTAQEECSVSSSITCFG